MNKTKSVYFSYDPLFLTRLFLQNHIEKYFDSLAGKMKTNAFRFANFEFMRTMSDAELESILFEFLEKEGYEEVSFVNAEHDFNSIFKIIHNSQRFENLENRYIKKGHAGMGVFDNQTKKFYPCDLGGHWHTIRLIIKNEYSHLFEAFRFFSHLKSNEELAGVSRQELENFIMSNFLLIGESKLLEDYFIK